MEFALQTQFILLISIYNLSRLTRFLDEEQKP